MKNNRLAFLSLLFVGMLSLGACHGGNNSESIESETEETESIEESSTEETSSEETETTESSEETEESSETESTINKYIVRFLVDGNVVQTSEIEEGGLVMYEGSVPTKNGYRFRSWDRDLYKPITADTDINAIFSEYAAKVVVDDFEQYEDSGSMIDEGWTQLGYSNATQTWTSETKAAVSLSTRSEDGHASLRFDSWENGVGYKFAKNIKEGDFTEAANAIRFKLMVPRGNTVRLLLNAAVSIQGKMQAPVFKHSINVQSSEFVEYTIPFNDASWTLWDNAGQTIASVADWTGIHQDVLINFLTRIEFYIQGDDGGHGYPYCAFLDSIEFVTLDDISYTEEENLVLFDRYTAVLNDEHTLRIDIDSNQNATAKVLDTETPIQVEGKVTVEGRNVEFKSSDDGQSLTYRGSLTNHGQLIKFESASGTFKTAVDDVDLHGVQVVENFEQYTESGKAYDQQNYDENQRSGLRGAYYAEHYVGTGSSDWAGGGWKLLPDGDEINLIKNSTEAHSGNNYGSFKHRKNEAIRYMQWDLFKGEADKHSYRGTTLGLWIKGFADKLTVSFYSQSAPTAANKDTYVRKDTFNEGSAATEWKHIEIELNPDVVYYGFMMLIEKDYVKDSNLLIDDIEVYTGNPYAKYQEPEPEPVKDLHPGMNFTAKIGGLVATKLDVLADSNIRLSVPGFNFTINGTYVVNEDVATLTFGETVYTANLSDDLDKLTFVSISGNDVVAQYLNNLSFEASSIMENAEGYTEPGQMYYQSMTDENKASGARGAYYCDFEPGGGSSPVGGSGWTLMGGNGDQLDLDTVNAYEGHNSLKFKRSSGYHLRFMQWELYKGTAKAHKGFNKFVMYFENNTADDITFDIYVFNVQKLNSANVLSGRESKEFTIPAHTTWTKCEVELNPKTTYYGYGVYTHRGSSNVYLNGDFAYFSSVDNDPTLNFYTKKNLELSSTNMGSIAFIFDEGGVFYLGFVYNGEQDGTYTMEMSGEDQILTLTIGNSTVKGVYELDMAGNVSFTITEVTGDLAADVTVGDVYTD